MSGLYLGRVNFMMLLFLVALLLLGRVNLCWCLCSTGGNSHSHSNSHSFDSSQPTTLKTICDGVFAKNKVTSYVINNNDYEPSHQTESKLCQNDKHATPNDENNNNNNSLTKNKHGIQNNINDKSKKQRPRIPVLQYHDSHVIVNKPAGMTVHRSAGSMKHKHVLSTLLKRQLARRVYPVHRLDHRTSGVIMFAFSSEQCGMLHDCLKRGEKSYVALLRGRWRFAENEVVVVNEPIVVNGVPRDAITEFQLLSTTTTTTTSNSTAATTTTKREEPISNNHYDPTECSLVLCKPKTGRTHQIRRHAARVLSQPILGDTEHGDSKVNRFWRMERGLDRLALHCLAIDLPSPHPGTKADGKDGGCDEENGRGRVQCAAPLPPDLSTVLKDERLEQLWTEAVRKEPRLQLEPVDYRGGSHGRHYKRRLENEDGRRKEEDKLL